MPTTFTGLGPTKLKPPAQLSQKFYTPIPPPQMPDYQDYVSNIASGQKQNINSYAKLLGQYGAPLRNLIFQNYPEMANLSSYLNERMAAPISPEMMEDYRTNFRSAVANQGWGQEVGGPAVAMQESGYVTKLQEQARQALVPQMMQFSGQLLGMTGLTPQPFGAQEVLGGYGMANQAAMQSAQFQSQQQQYQLEQYAAQEQSDWARMQYEETKRQTDYWTQYNQEKMKENDIYQSYLKSGMAPWNPWNPAQYAAPSPMQPYWYRTVPPSNDSYLYHPSLGF